MCGDCGEVVENIVCCIWLVGVTNGDSAACPGDTSFTMHQSCPTTMHHTIPYHTTIPCTRGAPPPPPKPTHAHLSFLLCFFRKILAPKGPFTQPTAFGTNWCNSVQTSFTQFSQLTQHSLGTYAAQPAQSFCNIKLKKCMFFYIGHLPHPLVWCPSAPQFWVGRLLWSEMRLKLILSSTYFCRLADNTKPLSSYICSMHRLPAVVLEIMRLWIKRETFWQAIAVFHWKLF